MPAVFPWFSLEVREGALRMVAVIIGRLPLSATAGQMAALCLVTLDMLVILGLGMEHSRASQRPSLGSENEFWERSSLSF